VSEKVKNRELLSAYLDGELSEPEKKKVEELLKSSLELRKNLEDLNVVKQLTQSAKRIPESPFFETRLMAAIEGEKPDTRKFAKWIPVVSLGLVTILIMLVLKFNPDFINRMWNSQKVAIAGFYKENLQPVLLAANLTNEDIFNFAFNNELPLDKTRNQYLLLGYDDSGKEFFEIRNANQNPERNSYKEFITAMDLNEQQKQTVDSIIGSYGKSLETQVLVNDKNTIAINPNLWSYRKAIFADLLVAAEKLNIKNLNRIVPSGISDSEKIRVVNAVEKLRTSPENQYIFVTPDSIFEEAYTFNPEVYEKELVEVEKKLKSEEKKIEQFSYKFEIDSALKHLARSEELRHTFRISIDSNICRIDIPEHKLPDIQIPDLENINSLVEEATKNVHFYAFKVPKVERSKSKIKIEYFDDDSVYSYEMKFDGLNMDSLANSKPEFDLYRLDELKQINPFNDSMLAKYQFDRDYYRRYYSDDELQRQMQELQKHLQQMNEEMKNMRIEVNKEVTKSQKK
jgi:hypothetical protein